MASTKPSKTIIVDSGARGNALDQLLTSIENPTTLQSSKPVIVEVGNQREVSSPYLRSSASQKTHHERPPPQQVYTKQEFFANGDAMTRLAKIQYNTAGVLDTVLHSNSAETHFFETVTTLWEQWLCERHRSVLDMRIV